MYIICDIFHFYFSVFTRSVLRSNSVTESFNELIRELDSVMDDILKIVKNQLVMKSPVWYHPIRLINELSKYLQFFYPLLSSFTLYNSITRSYERVLIRLAVQAWIVHVLHGFGWRMIIILYKCTGIDIDLPPYDRIRTTNHDN